LSKRIARAHHKNILPPKTIMTRHNHSVSRRNFIIQASAFAAVSSFGSSAFARTSAGRPFKMGLQLYTVREAMAKDPVGTLQSIAGIGYQDLETYGFDPERIAYYGFKASRFKQILVEQGLTSTSGHYDLFRYLNRPLPALQDYVAKCIEGALALEQSYITWPWLEPDSRTLDHFRKLAERLNVIGDQIRRAGLGLAYHNHDFEFIDHNGVTGYEILTRETDPELVKIQLDLFWSTHSSKLSAHDMFSQHPGRFVMWHIKDMDKHDRNRYTELGNGRIDFTEIMPDAKLAGLQYYYVEQGDHFAVDPLHSIATSAAYVKKYLQ
jgi:sugar phosphate isomerase/epimerase